jgi:hypothetical protein
MMEKFAWLGILKISRIFFIIKRWFGLEIIVEGHGLAGRRGQAKHFNLIRFGPPLPQPVQVECRDLPNSKQLYCTKSLIAAKFCSHLGSQKMFSRFLTL